jgi:hypothetical protein
MILTEIKTGDIMLVQTNTLLARAIQFFQKLRFGEGGSYNHAGLFVTNGVEVIEAIENGIENTNFFCEYSKPKYKSIIGLRPNFDTSKTDWIGLVHPYIGKTKYDFWDLIGLQSARMVTGRWFGSSIVHEKHFICGQWVAFCYNRLGNFKKEMPAVTYIAPIDLYLNTNFTHYIIK